MEVLQEWLTLICFLGLLGCIWNLNNRVYRLTKQVEGLISLEQGSDD